MIAPKSIRTTRRRTLIPCLVSLTFALTACTGGGASPSAAAVASTVISPEPSVGPSVAPTPSATPAASSAPTPSAPPAPSEIATIGCAKTPDASPVATVTWKRGVLESPTIKVGEAVAFVTQLKTDSTVTESTTTGRHCVNEGLKAGVPLVVTFLEPGDFKLVCRIDPNMKTVIHVQ